MRIKSAVDATVLVATQFHRTYANWQVYFWHGLFLLPHSKPFYPVSKRQIDGVRSQSAIHLSHEIRNRTDDSRNRKFNAGNVQDFISHRVILSFELKFNYN